jgi:asparagine synthase (glutamine-hydrolysing)
MCGILGVTGSLARLADSTFIAARDTMQHRGPDQAGVWWSADRSVGLAHRRLAIIDVSAAGQQPMSDASGRLHVVFNGEIYNFLEIRQALSERGDCFQSDSDTEVLLAAYRRWGLDCLTRLIGMFAFALYDEDRRLVFVARDRAGEKPLFYTSLPGGFAFASELKALMALPGFTRRLDLVGLDFFLTYGYVPGERCIVQGVKKLPPAHALTFNIDTGVTRVWRYWDLPPPPTGRRPFNELVDEFELLLERAVKRQLVADVPIGVLLSGGLDSGLVTAMASRVSSSVVRTFTITFPGHGSYDEGPIARRLSEHFGTNHTELEAQPASAALLPLLARQFDEPIADSSMVPTYLVSKLVREQATVALGGDGGDELFGGYPHYSLLLRQIPWRYRTPRFVKKAIGMTAAHLPIGLKGRNHLIGLSGDLSEAVAHVNVYFDRSARAQLRRTMCGDSEAYKRALCNSQCGLIRQSTEVDFRTTMVEAYLVKIDRASMLNSLEIRAPFLDHTLVEFAFGQLPDDFRATTADRKLLPRALAERLFPAGYDVRRKQGFSIPLDAWLKGPWGKTIEEVLRGADPVLFDARTVAKILAGQRRGFSNSQRLFALTMFELWRREYRVTF